MTAVLAVLAIAPAAATAYFAVFWTWFPWWRRHPAATYTMMFAMLGGAVVATVVWRDDLLAPGFAPPTPARVLGWAIVIASWTFGWIADRQLGLRVRAFVPFFDDDERISLRSTGAYAVVRHPIYASGLYFQLGMLLVTGRWAIAASMAVFGLGAVWFTRQEERRLRERLDDPAAYDHYRARVPALLPWPRPS